MSKESPDEIDALGTARIVIVMVFEKAVQDEVSVTSTLIKSKCVKVDMDVVLTVLDAPKLIEFSKNS